MKDFFISDLIKRFKEVDSAEPLIVRSPGRINFIGEHTDYNDGFVLPAAINKALYFAAAPNNSNTVRLLSYDFSESLEFSIKDINRTGKKWGDYIAGTLNEMLKRNYPLQGFTFVFGGDIPAGAGLSSSAALTAGTAFTINELFGFNIPRRDLAFFAMQAKNRLEEVNYGVTDQLINLFGEKNKAMKLDCRNLDFEMIDFNFPDVSVILFLTGSRNTLALTEYDVRRKQCDAGTAEIKKKYPEVSNLRDVNIGMLEEFDGIISPEIYSRCLYVIEENFRVKEASEFLRQKNIEGFGELLTLTHEGLRIDYEVSSPELDSLVYKALDLPGVYGSRMMGCESGLCTLNLVRKDRTEDFLHNMNTFYLKSKGIELKTLTCELEAGTSVI